MPPRVRLIGCGNPDAGDDGAGLEVVRRLGGRLPSGVDVVEAGPATRVLDLLDDVDVVIVVDAVRSTGGRRPPGTLIRAEADETGLPASIRGALSSHGFGLADAVGLAAAVGPVPHLVFHGVEIADATAGAGLSPAVELALPALTDAVAADVDRALV